MEYGPELAADMPKSIYIIYRLGERVRTHACVPSIIQMHDGW
jgi:hypothetical protein